MKFSSLFISKDLEDLHDLEEKCRQHHITLHAKALIRFEAIPFLVKSPYDVVFFTSPRAVEFFLRQITPPQSTVYACIGKSTADYLISKGYTPQFTGQNAGEPLQIALKFKDWLGDRKVLFPQSDLSKESIASYLPKNQVEHVAVYNTLAKCIAIDLSDVYVFTSPSNFNSFMQCNALPDQGVIAWGKTTEKELLKHGVHPTLTLKTSQLSELIHELFQ